MLPLLVLLAIGVHLLLPQIATIGATAAVLQRMHLWAVALAFVAQASLAEHPGVRIRQCQTTELAA